MKICPECGSLLFESMEPKVAALQTFTVNFLIKVNIGAAAMKIVIIERKYRG